MTRNIGQLIQNNFYKHLREIRVKQSIFYISLGTTIGLVLSIKLPWIEAMVTCARFHPDENYELYKKSTGSVKYNMSWSKPLKYFPQAKEI